MKLKFFILISASLATVGLLGSLPSAFGYSLDPQTNTKETQLFEDESGSSTGDSGEWTQNQGLGQEEQAIESRQFFPVVIDAQSPESSEANLAEQTDPVNSILIRIFVTFALISGGLLGFRQSRKYKEQRAKHVSDILQEIENLERIRKRKPEIYQSISHSRKKQVDSLKRIENINPYKKI